MKITFQLSGKAFFPICLGSIAGMLLLYSSCEKVVNIDLNSASPKLVIEGVVTDSAGPFRVILTKSGSYFDQPVLPPVSGAFITISDDLGTMDTLREEQPGIYFTSKIIGTPGHSYFLSVLSESDQYNASTTMQSHVEIDSLKVEESLGFGGRKNRNVICYFNDPKGEKNYYRIKFFVNGKTNTGNYRLYDDQYTDGEKIGIRAGHAEEGDTDLVVLMSIDKKAYDYYHTLQEILQTNPLFGSTPANPNTNLSNGALGYFAAYSYSTQTILIRKK
jgi:hypothetical protein